MERGQDEREKWNGGRRVGHAAYCESPQLPVGTREASREHQKRDGCSCGCCCCCFYMNGINQGSYTCFRLCLAVQSQDSVLAPSCACCFSQHPSLHQATSSYVLSARSPSTHPARPDSGVTSPGIPMDMTSSHLHCCPWTIP